MLPPDLPPSASPTSGPALFDGLAWEAPNAGLGAIVPTAGQFITSPVRAFQKMSLSVDLVRPISYFVVFVLVAAVLGQIWNQIFWTASLRAFQSLLEAVGQGEMWAQFAPQIARPGILQIVLGLVVAPLLYLVGLFVWTALVHGILVLVGGATSGFAASLRAMSYAGTASVSSCVPLLGGLLGIVWYLGLAGVGLAAAHRTKGWKAALAILLPIVLCCVCCIGGAVLFGAAFTQAIQQAS